VAGRNSISATWPSAANMGMADDSTGDGADGTYGRSADAYDLIYDGIGGDYAAEAAEVTALVRARRPAARTLLDVACGTGGHLVHLREQFAVEGVELSSHMATRARARLGAVVVHEGDMRTFALGRRFDAVTCLFSSIGYARTPEDLGQTGRGAHRGDDRNPSELATDLVAMATEMVTSSSLGPVVGQAPPGRVSGGGAQAVRGTLRGRRRPRLRRRRG